MKRIVFFITILFGLGYTGNAQPLKQYYETVDAYEYTILDESFTKALDSLVFGSGCKQIKDGKIKIFNVECHTLTGTESYEIRLDMTDIIYLKEDFRGCFIYRDYLFIWHNVIPDTLLRKSEIIRPLKTLRGMPFLIDYSIFILEYKPGSTIMTGVCCF